MISVTESLIIDVQRNANEIEGCLNIVERYTTDPYQMQFIKKAQAELEKITQTAFMISQEASKTRR